MKNISIRIKLLILLLLFCCLILTSFLISQHYLSRREGINEIKSELDQTEIIVLRMMKSQANFLLAESINPDYFEDGESEHIKEYESLASDLHQILASLSKNPYVKKFNFEIEELQRLAHKNQRIFSNLVDYIWLRGFKDYGTEGEMRKSAHQLEDLYASYIDSEDLLTLRRNEKDFIIRKQEKYAFQFSNKIKEIRNGIKKDNIPLEVQNEIISLLDKYENSFESIVRFEKKIGLTKDDGLFSQSNKAGESLLSQVYNLNGVVSDEKNELLLSLNTNYFILVIAFLLAIVIVSIKVSNGMTKRLKTLSNAINHFVESGYRNSQITQKSYGKDEVGELTKNFQVLENEITVKFKDYRERVEQRTQKILKQNKDLERHKNLLQEKSQDILSSIKYARRIQDSILPKSSFVRQLFYDHFIFYRPKDIVSGDFYWVENRGNKTFLAVADCTGHGVPGAFMSLLCHNFLNQAVKEKELEEPDQILKYVDLCIQNSLSQKARSKGSLLVEASVQDGMDIALLVLDRHNKTVSFTGALRPLFLVRGDFICEYTPDRYSIGGKLNGQIKTFGNEVISYQPGDQFYMLSDGYADQFGGFDTQPKKFKKKKLKELILSVRDCSMVEQRDIIKKTFMDWMGTHEQIDDVCVFGFRLD